jgi:hypothetical protein
VREDGRLGLHDMRHLLVCFEGSASESAEEGLSRQLLCRGFDSLHLRYKRLYGIPRCIVIPLYGSPLLWEPYVYVPIVCQRLSMLWEVNM